MKIKVFRSSTVGIYAKNTKILMDPWLTDGEYYGSWYHYPYFDLRDNIEELNSFDCIYISHIHPDHCSEKTLSYLKKDIPIYIHSYHEKFLKFKLERMGFKVYELENNKRTQINNDLFINIIAADNCNPELCFKFFGCKDLQNINGSNQIDTLSVIDDGRFSILNVNDSPYELSKESLETVLNEYGKIDILLTGYTGAGPFPQCIQNFTSKEKILEADKKKIFFLNQAYKFIEKIKPNYYIPFAGTYVLGGKMLEMNNFRGVSTIDEAYNYIDNLIKKKLDLKTKSLKINYENFFDIALEEKENLYVPIDPFEKNEYLKTLKNKKLDYEKEIFPKDEELISKSEQAFKKYLFRKNLNNFKSETNIYISLKDRFIKLDNLKNTINFPKQEKEEKKGKYIEINTDIRFLNNLLSGPKFAHWNNAEIGSHLMFNRQPNIFERGLYESMSYFHK